jgi:hypothetical protein
MRADFAWEMTDDLVHAGNRLLLRRNLFGLTWRTGVILWLLSLVLLGVAVFCHAGWLWLGVAVVTSIMFFLLLLITLVVPRLQAASLGAFLARTAGWPHRRFSMSVTPDAILLTSPVGQGLVELADLQEVLHDPQTTVLLFRDSSVVFVPTEVIPTVARQLMRFPGSEAPSQEGAP